MTAVIGPLDLVAEARDLLRDGDGATAGLWPRAAAILARQSLELSMARLWELRAYGLYGTSSRCQLLCLRVILGDDALAGRAAAAFDSLSRAVHHHPYELAPTRDELMAWITAAWDLANCVERIAADTGGRR